MNTYTFVTFQSLGQASKSGMARLLLPIIKCFDRSAINKYYVGGGASLISDVPTENVGFVFQIFRALIGGVGKLDVFSLIGYGRVRYLQELIFDLIISIRLKKATCLVSSAYLKKACEKNKNLGGLNIFLPGNPYDRSIYDRIHKESVRHDIKISDVYSYKRRVDFIDKSLGAFDYLIAFNKLQFETYVAAFGDKVSLVNNYAMPEYKKLQKTNIMRSAEITFCYVAHTVWLKGLVYLIDAWARRKSKSGILRIGGNINHIVKGFIDAQYGDLEGVRFEGIVTNLNEFLRSSHICVVPSLIDGNPSTIAEALYCGLPVIATNGCGAKDLIVDGVNGFIVEAGDGQVIADKIDLFIDNPALITQMSERAQVTINQFDNNVNQEVADAIVILCEKHYN